MKHFTHPYLLNPKHKVTINVVGVGGTGSRVITNLALMDKCLRALGHPGLHVTAFDDDEVTEANIGRQAFVASDLGINKALVIISRVNAMLGLQWEGYAYRYDSTLIRSKSEEFLQANILITCVDSLSSRRNIKKIKWSKANDTRRALYWLDIGNGKNFGQYILSTLEANGVSNQGTIAMLNDAFELHPEIMEAEDDKIQPSCSLPEALTKQDLFVNPMMAMQACHLLWKLITEGGVNYQGGYMNMDTMQTNLIKL